MFQLWTELTEAITRAAQRKAMSMLNEAGSVSRYTGSAAIRVLHIPVSDLCAAVQTKQLNVPTVL